MTCEFGRRIRKPNLIGPRGENEFGLCFLVAPASFAIGLSLRYLYGLMRFRLPAQSQLYDS